MAPFQSQKTDRWLHPKAPFARGPRVEEEDGTPPLLKRDVTVAEDNGGDPGLKVAPHCRRVRAPGHLHLMGEKYPAARQHLRRLLGIEGRGALPVRIASDRRYGSYSAQLLDYPIIADVARVQDVVDVAQQLEDPGVQVTVGIGDNSNQQWTTPVTGPSLR